MSCDLFAGGKWQWKSLSRVQLFVTPWTIQSMEFSRLEYWSELPFPSPGDLPNPGIESRSPALWADSLPAAPQGKPKNTKVGSLCLLQRMFLAQESNWGLLHCRWILYQLSYQSAGERVWNILIIPQMWPGYTEWANAVLTLTSNI